MNCTCWNGEWEHNHQRPSIAMRLWFWLRQLGAIPVLLFIGAVNIVHFGIHDTFLDMGALDAGINSLNLIGLYLLNEVRG